MDFYDIRSRINRLVHEKLRADHGDTALTRESVISEFTGNHFGDREIPADYLRAIETANQIADTARFMGTEYAREARRHGRSWAEIADVLGIDADEVSDPAVAAYERVAGTGWSSITSWRCACCEQRVSDRGPWNPHPDDNETGHATDCERHHREITAYERLRDGYDRDRGADSDWELDF